MRILVFAHDSSLYGASQSLFTLLKHLKQKDYQLLVLLPRGGELLTYLENEGIDYKVLYFPRAVIQIKKGYSLLNRIIDIAKFYKKKHFNRKLILKVCEEFKPHLIYTNTSVVTAGIETAVTLKIPHIWHVREFGWDDYKFKYLPSRNAVISGLLMSEKVIFISKAVKDAWLHDDKGKAEIIYNGFDINDCGTSRSRPYAEIKIGILGAIVPGKGQGQAIDAFEQFLKKFPNSFLYIYGDPIDQEYYQSLKIKALQISENIIFKSFEKDTDQIYQNLDIVLNCSLKEGFGRSIVEAMIKGIPVIANNNGGITEIIEQDSNGLLFNSKTEDLTKQLTRIFEEPDLYERLSANALAQVTQRYSIEKYVESMDIIFKSSNHNNLNNG
ncbi:glycosyltransferase family 4 protein [Desertivirga xinjiangensis]|uniref:glycosyltransferase family 4 protein n=1 Tax=Desertivirga xinjiangensis TaxID=539206 RepID=UPI00210B5C64